jgi:hypothetical protein
MLEPATPAALPPTSARKAMADASVVSADSIQADEARLRELRRALDLSKSKDYAQLEGVHESTAVMEQGMRAKVSYAAHTFITNNHAHTVSGSQAHRRCRQAW